MSNILHRANLSGGVKVKSRNGKTGNWVYSNPRDASCTKKKWKEDKYQ